MNASLLSQASWLAMFTLLLVFMACVTYQNWRRIMPFERIVSLFVCALCGAFVALYAARIIGSL